MKKILTMLLLGFSSQALAQISVALPTEPVITSTNTVSPNASAALSSASTNRVFIDQAGNNPNFNINQLGSGNNLGSLNQSVIVRGNNVTLTTMQEGNNNSISLNLNTPLADGVTNATIRETGNNNSIDAACGAGFTGSGISLTGCNNSTLNWQITGNSNSLQFRGTGNNITSSVNVSGNYNGIYTDVIGNKHTQTVMSSGDYNSYNIVQSSSGTNGSSLVIDQTGNGTTFSIQQTGTIDNVLNIKSIANSGTFNILQRN